MANGRSARCPESGSAGTNPRVLRPAMARRAKPLTRPRPPVGPFDRSVRLSGKAAMAAGVSSVRAARSSPRAEAVGPRSASARSMGPLSGVLRRLESPASRAEPFPRGRPETVPEMTRTPRERATSAVASRLPSSTTMRRLTDGISARAARVWESRSASFRAGTMAVAEAVAEAIAGVVAEGSSLEG